MHGSAGHFRFTFSQDGEKQRRCALKVMPKDLAAGFQPYQSLGYRTDFWDYFRLNIRAPWKRLQNIADVFLPVEPNASKYEFAVPALFARLSLSLSAILISDNRRSSPPLMHSQPSRNWFLYSSNPCKCNQGNCRR